MTNTGRLAVVMAVLVLAGGLAAVGALTAETAAERSTYILGFTTVAGSVLGFVFGRANGEKALAGAIVTAAADQGPTAAVGQAIDAVTPTRSAGLTTPTLPTAADSPRFTGEGE